MNECFFRKADLVIIAILLLASLVPVFVFTAQASGTDDLYVVIYVDGSIYKEIKTSEGLVYDFEISSGNDSNHIRIEGSDVWMCSASCPDQYCVKQGHASRAGDTIVCLPNRIYIEIRGKGGQAVDDISH